MDSIVANFFQSPPVTQPLRPVAITLKGIASEISQATHLVLVIDVSDSMEYHDGESLTKLASVKKSIEFLLPLLTPRDMVSIITFGEDSHIHLTAEQISETGRLNIQRKVSGLRTAGCTNMSAGLLDIQRLMDDMNAQDYPAHKHGVLLLTDGMANRGHTKPDQLLSIIQKIQTKYPALTFNTFGYGKDHNSTLLKDIAATGGGSYNVVYTLEDVATTFGEVLGGLTTVVAQNVKVLLPAGSEPMTGYAIDASAACVKVGDVYAENEVIVLANIPSNTSTIKVTWTDMRDISFEEITVTIFPAELETPKPIQLALYRYKIAEILKKAPNVPMRLVAENRLAVQNLLDELRALPYGTDVIVAMLCDDLQKVLEGFDRGMTQEHVTEVTQHAAYLSMGRGLRSMMPGAASAPTSASFGYPPSATTPFPHDPTVDEEPEAMAAGASLRWPAAAAAAQTAFSPPVAASPFSNPRQRRITQHIRETISSQLAPSQLAPSQLPPLPLSEESSSQESL